MSEIPNPNGHLTNIEKWKHYCDGLISPDSFITFGFYYLIGSALQRRVFVGPKHKPLYPNQYVVFVSEPGIGKGLVIQEVSKAIRYHKLVDPRDKTTTIEATNTGRIPCVVESVDRQMVEGAALADFNSGKLDEERPAGYGPMASKHSFDKPLLFPVAADSTTFEALVGSMSRALRRKNYSEYNAVLGRNVQNIYTHSSMCFCLEEISSLFRKKAEDVANFLQIAYDCGDYKKDTKTQGTDRIHKCCLSFLGGTQPAFMKRSFSDGLLNEGFASRAWFIYESKNRKTQLFIPELNEFQQQCYNDILEHIKKLSDIYGNATYTPEASAYLDEWWKRAQTARPNISEKLLHYYARKNIHVQKLAMAIHFADNFDMIIGIDSCKEALRLLSGAEKRMDHAILTRAENPHYALGLKLIKFLQDAGPRSLNELRAKFWEDCGTADPLEALKKVLEHYQVVGKINTVGTNPVKYDIIVKEEEIE